MDVLSPLLLFNLPIRLEAIDRLRIAETIRSPTGAVADCLAPQPVVETEHGTNRFSGASLGLGSVHDVLSLDMPGDDGHQVFASLSSPNAVRKPRQLLPLKCASHLHYFVQLMGLTGS